MVWRCWAALLLLAFVTPARCGAQSNSTLNGTVSANSMDWWGSVTNAVNRLSNKASCYADNKLEEFDLTFCELASEDDPCPEDCRVELEKLDGACIMRILVRLSEEDLAQAEEQLYNCGMDYESLSNAAPSSYGSLLLPLVVTEAVCVALALLQP